MVWADLVAPPVGEDLVVSEALVLESAGRAGRNTLFTDAVEAQWVAGHWRAPSAGETVPLADGRTRTWSMATADTNGWFSGAAMRGGYAFFRIQSPEARVVILNAAGHSMADRKSVV